MPEHRDSNGRRNSASERYIRFTTSDNDSIQYGLLAGETVIPLTKAPWNNGQPAPQQAISIDAVTLKAPVEPSKVICIGLNYHAHVAASFSADKAPSVPLLFFKPPSAIIGPGEKIIHPEQSNRVDYEAELTVIIGRIARHVSQEDAAEYIFGFTCGNDVTARDLQKVDSQWGRAKGFDTFCPLGPWIVTHLDYRDLLEEGIHNGEIKQSGRTSQMIFPIPFLISYLSSIMTLLPGDVILTGTPSGIAPLKPGDSIDVRVEGIGSLCNRMAKDTD